VLMSRLGVREQGNFMDTGKLPSKSATYASRMTDNRIWDRFELRSGDVIVSTPPKCGTTWTQALVLSLIFGKPGMDILVDDLSIWLDPGFRDQSTIAEMFQAQSHRRCIKTHTPLDGVPYDPDCTYITVYRHPIDAHFSMRRHVSNLNVDLIQDRFPEALSDSLAFFLGTSPDAEMADGITLEAIVHHYRSFKSFVGLPNVHIFHYADMRQDLLGHTRNMAALLGCDLDEAILEEIAASLQFERMQANARSKSEQSAQSSATFKDPAAFFDSASSRKWEGKLTDGDLMGYRSRLGELLPREDALWLENGGMLPT
jgi:aryl sulfotransferase